MDRLIAHVDMDCFYAAVEVLDNPDLKGRPVIVGGSSPRGVVSSASYEARRYGVRSAMPIFKARRLCPEGCFRPVRMGRYQEVSQAIMELLGTFAPAVEQVSIDEAFLDLTGTGRIHGPAVQAGRKLKDFIRDRTGIICSVGLAPNRLIAKIASDLEKPDGLVVVPAEEAADFLAPLPAAKLPGVGPRLAARLTAMGVNLVADLRRLESGEMVRLFGSQGRRLFEMAWGRDETPIQPRGEPKSISAEVTLERDTGRQSELISILSSQALRVSRRLRLKGYRCRTITLKLKYSDFRQITRSQSLSEATDSTKVIFQKAAGILRRHSRGEPVRLVGLGLSNLEPAAQGQPGLFTPEPLVNRPARLDSAVDEIIRRYGFSAIKMGVSLEGK